MGRPKGSKNKKTLEKEKLANSVDSAKNIENLQNSLSNLSVEHKIEFEARLKDGFVKNVIEEFKGE